MLAGHGNTAGDPMEGQGAGGPRGTASLCLIDSAERKGQREGGKHWPQEYRSVCSDPGIVAALTKLHHTNCAAW